MWWSHGILKRVGTMNIKSFIGLTLGIAAVASVGVNTANAQSVTPNSMDTLISCAETVPTSYTQACVRVPYSVTLDKSGNVRLGFAGNDKELKNGFLVGLSMGYEDTGLVTGFNSGNLDGKAYFIAPYASLTLKKGFSVDVSLGYARAEYEQDRLESQTRERVTANDTDANRYFGSLNLNVSKKVRKATIGGTVGTLYSLEDRNSFIVPGTKSITNTVGRQFTRTGQARFGLNANVNLGKINPYAKIIGVYDFTKTKVKVGASQVSPSQDDFGADFTVGVNLRSKNFTGTLEGYTSQFRDDWTEYGGSVRLRVDF